MKRLSVSERVAVENRTYKPGEYSEADMPVQHFDELLRTGFGNLIEDGTSDLVKLHEPETTINELEPQDLFPTEVLNDDLKEVTEPPTAAPEVAPSLLDGTVKEIKESLPGLPDDRLFEIMEEECAGKQRKGVIEAIEAEIDARAQAADNNKEKAE